jgi:hypothetical protein
MLTIGVNVKPDDEAFPKASTSNSDTANSNILDRDTTRAVSISSQHHNLHFKFTISRFFNSREPYASNSRDNEMSDCLLTYLLHGAESYLNQEIPRILWNPKVH